MNEENQISYYAIIPATVRYDNRLKAAEKLLYGEVTALANKCGYCYAQNRYFSKLYDVSIETISRWFSNLQKYGYIQIEIIKSENKEIISRNIYISDLPYLQKNQYPYPQNNQYSYCQKNQDGIVENVKENNIKYNIDDLFYYTMHDHSKVPIKFYEILENMEFIYTEEILSTFQKDKIHELKEIIYTLYNLYFSKFSYLLPIFKRDELINLYNISLTHNPENFLNYYERAIINKYTNNST